MVQQENHNRITAIVPAHNEASRIGKVLEILTTYSKFNEVIVVDDGSIDDTENVIKRFPVHYVKNSKNMGKGRSMDYGVALAKSENIFFSDADITGLTHEIIDEIVNPVLTGEVDMCIGMRNRKWYFVHQVLNFVPLLGGERALTKNLWQKIPPYYKEHFRIEVALNYFADHHGRGLRFKIIKGVTQVIKEKKYGFWTGTQNRWGMFYDICSALIKLHLT